VLLLHSKEYAEEAGAVAAASGAVAAPTGLSFDMFACLVGGASVLISPDTAAVHLASAFGVPVVALYIHADPDLRIWDPVGVPCETLETSTTSLADIPPGAVLEAFERLVAATGALP
jgi:ADP-heptose:LPS heptosyltransferase